MDAERWGGRAGAGVVVMCWALLLAPGSARAQGVTGSLQVQYQRLEQNQILTVDGIRRRQLLTQELWTQTYQADHQLQLRPTLGLTSQFRWDEVRRPGSAERTRTPYGALRLSHPWFGVGGSYRPVSSRSSYLGGPSGFLEEGTAVTPSVLVSRNQEAQVSAYLAAPRLPRVDASWSRRHRDGDALYSEESHVSRTLSTGYEVPAFYVRGSYSDLARENGGFSTQPVQRNYQGATGVRINPSDRLALSLGYNFTESRQDGGALRAYGSRSHLGTVSSSFRQSRIASWGASYTYRVIEGPQAVERRDVDHEGGLSFSLQPTRGFNLSAGAGARTERSAERSELRRFATGVISSQGQVRRHLRASTSLSHSTNWAPTRAPWSLDSWQGNLTARLRPGLEVSEIMVVSATSDSAVRDARYVTQNALQVQATPVRSVTVIAADRFYHTGPGLFRIASASRSRTVDVRMRLGTQLELTANHSRTSLVGAGARTSSTVFGVRWNPSRRFQFSGNYSRSESAGSNADVGFLSGSEFATGRLLVGLTRTVRLNLGGGLVDPGKDTRSRQLDASVSKSFGR